jgi:hypothetical protein
MKKYVERRKAEEEPDDKLPVTTVTAIGLGIITILGLLLWIVF